MRKNIQEMCTKAEHTKKQNPSGIMSIHRQLPLHAGWLQHWSAWWKMNMLIFCPTLECSLHHVKTRLHQNCDIHITWIAFHWLLAEPQYNICCDPWPPMTTDADSAPAKIFCCNLNCYRNYVLLQLQTPTSSCPYELTSSFQVAGILDWPTDSSDINRMQPLSP